MDEEKKPTETRIKTAGMSAPGLTNLGGGLGLSGHNQGLERTDLMDQREQARLLAANRSRLEHMDRNIADVVASIKSEISFAAKRDTQLVECSLTVSFSDVVAQQGTCRGQERPRRRTALAFRRSGQRQYLPQD